MLSGHLSTMPLSDLLQWISDARFTGRLEVDHGRARTQLFLRDGMIVAVSTDDRPILLGQFLLFRGSITKQDLREAVIEQQRTGASLADILKARNCVDSAEMARAVEAKAEEAIFSLFEVQNGSFVLQPKVEPSPKSMRVRLNVRDLTLRGMKRLDDRERIREVFPDGRMVLRHTDREPVHHDAGYVEQVYQAVDGKRSIEEITLFVHGSEFMVGKALFDLLQGGFVEPVARAPLPRAVDPPGGPVKAPRPVTDPLVEADRLISAGKHEAALHLLSELARERPAHAAVRRLQERATNRLNRRIEDAGLLPGKVPVLLVSLEAVDHSELTPEAECLLNMVDGSWDIAGLISVAPIRAEEVLRELKSLLDRGLIELRDAVEPQESRGGVEIRRVG